MPRKRMTLKQRIKNLDRIEKRKDSYYKQMCDDYDNDNDERRDKGSKAKQAYQMAAWEIAYSPRLYAAIVKYINDDGVEMAIVLRHDRNEEAGKTILYDLTKK